MTTQKGRCLLLGAVLFLSGSLVGFFAGRSGDDKCVFTVTVESDRPVETRLFYDTGKDFNEAESRRAVVYHSGQAVTLSFLFPGDKLRRLRFDPARSAAVMCIRHAAITYDGRDPFTLSLETMIPQQGIRLLRQDAGRLCFETEGEDPILLLKEIGIQSRRWAMPVLYSLGGGILALAGAFSLAWLYKHA